jgi:5'-3' exoribonuclease 2
MGIFRYFYWHFHTYPDSIIPVKNGQFLSGFDIFALDLNAIFHPVCQKYYFESSGPKTYEGCYLEICKEIDRLVGYVTPKEELILSIDGVAGLSKVNQQRQRRYRSAKEKSASDRQIFDTNQISVGTAFIRGLAKAIAAYFTNRSYAVVMMDDQVAGEGEHKIIRYLQTKEKKKMCIYSPDADLLMLGIGLNKKNVFIFRPNIYHDLDCAYFTVSIDKFKKSILAMVDPAGKYKDKSQKIVNDFIFLLFFLGNDFLPHSPSYEIKYGGINKILALYQKSVVEHNEHLIDFDHGIYQIRLEPFARVLEELADGERQMIETKYKAFRGCPNKLLDKYMNRFKERFDEYREEYYKVHFEDSIHDVCMEYLKGLCFVGTYYHIGMPDWLQYYKYHHGPFFRELLQVVQTIKHHTFSVEFEKHEPLRPLEQLMCVLPYESRRWLPKCIHPYYEEKSPIVDMCPREFEIDKDGVEQEYEAIVLLPPIDVVRIREAFKEVESELTEEEQERNYHTY